MKALVFVVVLCMGMVCTAPVFAQSNSAFTYQGELKNNGDPVNGLREFEFILWDARSNGSAIGSAIYISDVELVDGLFSVELDFGVAAFNNDRRWLQIEVEGVILTPRQEITRTPYSIQTRGIFVDDNEKIGIGTTAPTSLLHVADGPSGTVGKEVSLATLERDDHAYLSLLSPDNFERGIFFGGPSSSTSGGILYNNPTLPNGFQFRTDGNQNRMVINDDGDVGIGTENPERVLHTRGDAVLFERDSNDAAVLLRNTTDGQIDATLGLRATGPNDGYTFLTNQDGQPMLWITDNNVGINTAGFLLQHRLTVNGTACKTGGGPWSVFSDRRLKKNIVALDGSLDRLMSLRGVSFEFIDPDPIHELPGERIGMIAQDVEKVFPDWVSESENGYKTLSFMGFEALTVEAMRDLREEKNRQIEVLVTDNKELHAKNAILEMRLKRLEALMVQLLPEDN